MWLPLILICFLQCLQLTVGQRKFRIEPPSPNGKHSPAIYARVKAPERRRNFNFQFPDFWISTDRYKVHFKNLKLKDTKSADNNTATVIDIKRLPETFVKQNFFFKHIDFTMSAFVYKFVKPISTQNDAEMAISLKDVKLEYNGLVGKSDEETPMKCVCLIKNIFCGNLELPWLTIDKEDRNAIKQELHKKFGGFLCELNRAYNRFAKIRRRLSEYSDLNIGHGIVILNDMIEKPTHAPERMSCFDMQLCGHTVHPENGVALHSSADYSGVAASYCPEKPGYELSVAVSHQYQLSLFDHAFKHSDAIFSRQEIESFVSPLGLKWWDNVDKVAKTYAEQKNGSLRYYIKLSSAPSCKCQELKCAALVNSKAHFIYTPFNKSDPIQIANFSMTASLTFDVYVKPSKVSAEEYPDSKCSVLTIYGKGVNVDVKSITMDFVRKTQMKSGEKNVDTHLFQKEMFSAIVSKLISRGLDVVYPLHKELDVIDPLMVMYELQTCLYANYQRATRLAPIVSINQELDLFPLPPRV